MINSNNGNLVSSNISITQNTIVRIYFDEEKQTINEMELLKIVSQSERTFRLSNGVTICKFCLMPYHSIKNYHRGEEYFFLEKLII